MNDKPLTNLTILVTRPEHQAKGLAQLIKNAGGTPILFPTLEIIPLEHQENNNIGKADMAIFISPNAVHMAKQYLPQLQNSTQIISMGEGTTQALSENNITPDLQPSHFNTEALLSMREFHEIENKTIVIFKGEGGRESLFNTLKERAANVIEINCYKRQKPNANITPLVQNWVVDLIVSTSGESLENLAEMLDTNIELLKQTPLLVISDRLAKIAVDKALTQQAIIAKNATDNEIVNAIIEWNQSNGKN